MSGFGFFIRCTSCGLTSAGYPYRYDATVQPTLLQLPAANRTTQRFEQIDIPIDGAIDDDVIVALAAERSTDDVTVCVPHISSEHRGISLRPSVPCPRCGRTSVEAPFGSPRKPQRPCASIDQLVDETRAVEDGTVAVFRLAQPPAVVRCNRYDDEGRSMYGWHLEPVDGGDVTPAVDALRANLERRGSTCSEPHRTRAFVSFDERPT